VRAQVESKRTASTPEAGVQAASMAGTALAQAADLSSRACSVSPSCASLLSACAALLSLPDRTSSIQEAGFMRGGQGRTPGRLSR